MYSQSDEEQYILEACKGSQRRRLLDIGAWDPIDKSNSRALIESGWEALLIEPSPGPLRNLVAEYGSHSSNAEMAARVKVLCAVVGLEHGVVSIAISNDAVSTTEKGHAHLWRERGGYIGSMLIPSLTLADIFNRFGSFDFVNIDTEGTSVDLLNVLLATEMFPKCICVEHDSRELEAIQAAQRRGYRLLWSTRENLVFSL